MKLPHVKTLIVATLASLSTVQAEDGLLLDLVLLPRAGDRFEHVEFSCWLPDPAKPVEAVIIHQHGCTNASPQQHPPITGDWHWRALARRNDAALLVPMYQVDGPCSDWNDPGSGSEAALFAALTDFAKRSGRPELKDAPWVLWGHSGGSSWSAQMMVRHPERVLAASFRGGCHKQFGDRSFRERFLPVAREIPLLFVWGRRETVPSSKHHVSWEPMNTMFRELREQGGRVGRVIDPRSEHGCDDSRLLILPFFDTVLAARAAGKTVPGALVDLSTFESRENNESHSRDPLLAWLPEETMAERWRQFSTEGTLRPVNPKLKAPKLTVARDEKGRASLHWSIVPELDGGLRALRIHRDGQLWKNLGLEAEALLATARDSTPAELRPSGITDDSPGAHLYTLTFLDAAGNESPPSDPANAP